MRVALEASCGFDISDSVLTPGLDLGLHHDGRDAETGTGIELGGRMAYAVPDTGLREEASLRALIAREGPDYGEWRAPSAWRLLSGDAASRSGWCRPGGRREAAWSSSARCRTREGSTRGRTSGPESCLEGELGQGMALFGDGLTGTQNVSFGLTGAEERDYRIGWRLTSLARGDPNSRSRSTRCGESPPTTMAPPRCGSSTTSCCAVRSAGERQANSDMGSR